MKGISIPKFSFNGSGINAESIKNAISSSVPNLESIAKEIDIESTATQLLSDAISDGIVDLPSDIKNLIE